MQRPTRGSEGKLAIIPAPSLRIDGVAVAILNKPFADGISGRNSGDFLTLNHAHREFTIRRLVELDLAHQRAARDPRLSETAERIGDAARLVAVEQRNHRTVFHAREIDGVV